MKTYKIKSFIYFLLFATAAFFYNHIEEQEEFKEKIATTEVVKTELDNLENKDLEESDPNKL